MLRVCLVLSLINIRPKLKAVGWIRHKACGLSSQQSCSWFGRTIWYQSMDACWLVRTNTAWQISALACNVDLSIPNVHAIRTHNFNSAVRYSCMSTRQTWHAHVLIKCRHCTSMCQFDAYMRRLCLTTRRTGHIHVSFQCRCDAYMYNFNADVRFLCIASMQTWHIHVSLPRRRAIFMHQDDVNVTHPCINSVQTWHIHVSFRRENTNFMYPTNADMRTVSTCPAYW